ncbi:unnamed protein product, partial [Phaeothamnion confervicola]
IVTVLWEDQRGVSVKSFGPDVLLKACVADIRGVETKHLITAIPKKGVGNVLKALENDLRRLSNSGPVFAVIDRDQIRNSWQPAPPDCMTGLKERIKDKAPGNYDIVFLVENIETLVAACCEALGLSRPTTKPNPDARDRILQRAAWGS